jgi:hypothetical protein
MIVVTPLHAHYSPARLERVLDEMRRRGAPWIRAHFDEPSGAWFTFEGTHRLRAALALGLAPVLVPLRWPRSQPALARARFAARTRGHAFPRVDVVTLCAGAGTRASVQAAQVLAGLDAYSRNMLAAWGTAFTTYENEHNRDVCRELVAQAKAWSRTNYDYTTGRWCGEGSPP